MTDFVREYRKIIYVETQQYYNSGIMPKPLPSKKSVYMPRTWINVDPTIKTEFHVYNMDTLDCAIMLSEKYPSSKICVLNMANPHHAGGGVENGAIAQEESIFRRSNYFQTLTQDLYPIKANELIYSPKVHVSRRSEKDNFTYYANVNINKGYYFSFIASCAPIDPVLNAYTYNNYYKLMYNKVCHILDVAIENNHDCVLLGALGCGAFNNPKEIVAKIFSEVVLNERKYNGFFKEVSFAILKNVYGKGNVGEVDNFDVFGKYFPQS